MSTIPVIKNQKISLKIDSVGSNGSGIGRMSDYVIFVPGALPDEKVLAHIIKVTPRYAIGKLVNVEIPSPNRTAPLCDLYGKCGGCSLQHMTYASQLEVKQKEVKDLLQRQGKVYNAEFYPIIPAENPLYYRNKGSFPFGLVDGSIQTGFFAPRSHRLVPVYSCCIEKEEVLKAAHIIRDWAAKYQVPVYDEVHHRGCLRHVSARVTRNGKLMIAIVTKGRLLYQNELVQHILSEIDNVVSIIHNINNARSNVIFGPEFHQLWGSEYLIETICGLDFFVHCASFLQVNTEQTEKLYQTAIDFLSPSNTDTVCDVYCGIGTISLLVAKHVKKVYGIEIVSAAIENAKHNAQHNKIENAEFICAAAEDILPQFLTPDIAPNAIIVDPPRKGMEHAALSAIINSTATRLVYISCNPATLARDCEQLSVGGFQVQKVQPVDMFPMTSHVETVVLLSRK